MASSEQQELERRERKLQTQEQALERRMQQHSHVEARLKANQERVAEKERANQKKAQELMQRERKLDETARDLASQSQMLEQAHAALELRQKKRNVLVIPILLLVCVVAGYTAFLNLGTKQDALQQATRANENIDKLASVLNMTQEEVLAASDKLRNKRQELEKTKSMLNELRQTTEQLEVEILSLRENQAASLAEKEALGTSAATLSQQLKQLRAQLEDEYLTIDINEAFIDYQENNRQQLQQLLTHYKQTLDEREARVANLQQALTSQQALTGKQDAQLNALQSTIANQAQEIETLESRLEEAKRQETKETAPSEPAGNPDPA